MAGIDVRRVAYGEASVRLLLEQVRTAKAGEVLTPVTVVVPSNYAAVALRRELSRRGGVAAVSFLTLYRLGERLGSSALSAAGRRPVSASVVVQAVRAVLEEAPGVLARVAAHPVTELALAAAHRELSGVSGEALDAVASKSPRAGDVVRIVRDVGERLAGRWHDEHDLLIAAADLVRTGDLSEVGPVIVHLPQRLPPGAGALLHVLAARVSVVVNVGATGAEAADQPVVDGLERAGIAVPVAEGVERPLAARVVSVSDPDDEVRVAVHLVVDAARDATPLGSMAILFGASVPYARLLHEHLAAAGIPANGTPVRTIGEMLAGGALRGLLALPDRRFRRSSVLAVLSSARVVDAVGRPVPVRAWERVSRAASVVEGNDWADRLEAFADEQEQRAARAETDERVALARRCRRDAEQAGALGTSWPAWSRTCSRVRAWPHGPSCPTGPVVCSLATSATTVATGPSPSARPQSGSVPCSNAWPALMRSTARRPPSMCSVGRSTECSTSRSSAWGASVRVFWSGRSPVRSACVSSGSSCSAWPRVPFPTDGSTTRC